MGRKITSQHIKIDNIELKKCTSCKCWLPISNFSKDKNRWDNLLCYCKPCSQKINGTIFMSRYRNSRKEFLKLYGNRCSCCGENIVEFLTIEHRNGLGRAARKKIGSRVYVQAIKEYRPDLYTILCWNCNCAKGRYGKCPHQDN